MSNAARVNGVAVFVLINANKFKVYDILNAGDTFSGRLQVSFVHLGILNMRQDVGTWTFLKFFISSTTATIAGIKFASSGSTA